MAYQPNHDDHVVLSSGKALHPYFDHLNHAKFDKKDHLMAADWHDRQMAASFKKGHHSAALFHGAHKQLHQRAAAGKPTRIQFAPADTFFNHLEPQRREHWVNRSKQIREENKALAPLEKYRTWSTQLTKSRTVDMQEMKRIEQDRNPPSAVLVPKETQHPEKPAEMDDMVKRIIVARRAERDGNRPTETERKPELPPEQQEAIRQAIAARRGQRG